MNTIHEPARETPVIAQADVVVVGGGPGGLPAAIAAARRGADVLLIERYGFLGGLATAGLVAPILGHTASRSSTPIVAGLLREFTERMHALDGAPTWEESLRERSIRFDAEAFKRVADEMVQESGVRLLLHTLAVEAVVEGDQITAVIVESKAGRRAVRGNVFVDATGDADLAFRAGAETRQGRDFDGRVQSMGSFIHIGGVEKASEKQIEAARREVERALRMGRLRFYHPGFASRTTYHRDFFSPNMTRWAGDPTDLPDLTRAELEIREQAWQLLSLLKTLPGFENAYLRQTSPQVGARESRQVIGDYVLTGEDLRQGRKFDDAIARGSWWIDIHCPLGHTYPVHLCVVECPRGARCPFWSATHDRHLLSRKELYPPQDDWYDIPYRCLTPKGVDNLLVSGRCISATHEAMAGARVMGTCVAVGQAAGVAAALAAHKGIAPRAVQAAEVQRLLRADGALL